MLEPMRPKKSKRNAVADFVILILIILGVLGLAQLCTSSGELQLHERDCLAELRSSTRKDASFTEAEVVEYGRCIEARGGE